MNVPRFTLSALVAAVVFSGAVALCGAEARPALERREPFAAFFDGKFPRSAPGSSTGGWTAVDAFPQLTFEDPVFVLPEPGSNRLYVCGRQGTVHAVVDDPTSATKILVLDLSDVTQGYDDCGLLSIAFHPEFGRAASPNRGHFYVAYQYSPRPVVMPDRRRPPARTPGYNRVSRFTLPDGWFSGARDPAAVRASELVLINQFDEHVWHSVGGLFFGADGFLYISNGDEGDGLDSFDNSQKIDDGLFAGVLRIDVNNDPAKSHPIRRQPRNGGILPAGWPESFTAHYSIPNDNPWVDPTGATLEEFWAIGLRNPYRMTYDRVTDRIWVGDIGQRSREEIDVIRKGGNYQWAYREGSVVSAKPKPSPLSGIDSPPVYDYDRTHGGSVIGGYVYRGRRFPELVGKYIFGDNATNRVWAMSYDGTNPPAVTRLAQLPWPGGYSGLASFGLDREGEILVCKLGRVSKVFRLARVAEPVADPPALLSQTGAFADLRTLSAATGVVPYEVNAPLWSDGALKRRWLAVPGARAPYAAHETIGFRAKGGWAFPAGTVFIKHFELGIDEANPAARKRLETRFLVCDVEGGVYGLTYRWRADGSDAELLRAEASEELEIKSTAGSRRQTWYYPSRTDCIVCHNANAGHVLGVNTRQLNGDCRYPPTGAAENQLRALSRVGYFNPARSIDNIANLDQLAAIGDETAPLAQRVRSYLDSNCAQCHRPGGVHGYFDARYETPLARQGLLNGEVSNPLGIAGAKVVVPQHPDRSLLHLRLRSSDGLRMPTLANNAVDTRATEVLLAWIAGLPADAGTRPEERVAVLTNHDVHFEFRGRVGSAAYLSERATALVDGSALSAEQLAVLEAMLGDAETFVIAHVLLSHKLDAVTGPTDREMNGMVLSGMYPRNVTIDPAQAPRLAEYWARRLAQGTKK